MLAKTKAARVLLLVVLLPGGVGPARAAQRPGALERGGVSLVLAVKADAQHAASSVERTAAVIRKRCAGLRIRCEVRPGSGEQSNRLLLRFSPASDAARVKRVLLARGFELRAVVSPSFPLPVREYPTRAEAEAEAGNDQDVFPFDDFSDETYLVAERASIITGDDVRNCVPLFLYKRGISDEYEVNCRLTPAGAARMKSWTGANINRYIAVVFNGRALIAPYIRSPIWLDVTVSGGFDRERAREVALILSSGNLPAPVEFVDEGGARELGAFTRPSR